MQTSHFENHGQTLSRKALAAVLEAAKRPNVQALGIHMIKANLALENQGIPQPQAIARFSNGTSVQRGTDWVNMSRQTLRFEKTTGKPSAARR